MCKHEYSYNAYKLNHSCHIATPYTKLYTYNLIHNPYYYLYKYVPP